MKRKVIRWIKVIVLLYSIIGITLYYVQDKILFHPVALQAGYQFHFDVPFEEVNIPLNNTDTISMVKFFPADSIRKGIVIYFHGNKGNINRYQKFAANFTKHGYEVWMEDYPGFGKTTGPRDEHILYQQAEQVYKMALTKFHQDSIVIYGKSFGTGIAAYLASVKDCKQLILETPYYDVPDIFGCYLPVYPVDRMIGYKIPTFEYIKEVKAPVIIFHGTSDGVIPYRCASKLKPVLKAGDLFVTIENGTHHNLDGFPLFKEKLDSLLNR